MDRQIPASELILNSDRSIYHLHLHPHDIATDIITVGDPDRVDVVASRLDNIRVTKQKREFKTVTGSLGGKDLTIISTGIGTDNIDIVLTELDILANVNLDTRRVKSEHTPLNFYRLGTSGALREDIPIDSIIISQYAVGLEGLMLYYDYTDPNVPCEVISEEARYWLKHDLPAVSPYTTMADEELVDRYATLGRLGITITATGFYGPQCRQIRARPRHATFLDDMANVRYKETPVTNLEMETAGIYGISHLLGHKSISLNAILANRKTGEFSTTPSETVSWLIDSFLDLWCA